MKRPALDRIKAWVENEGGFLYTEDWGLVEITGVLWPDQVGSGGRGAPNLNPQEEERRRLRGLGHRQADADARQHEPPSHARRLAARPQARAQEDRARARRRRRRRDPSPAPRAAQARHLERPSQGPGPGRRRQDGHAPASASREPGEEARHQWQVDEREPTIEVKDTTSVISLLESEELAQLDGGFPIVAVTFSFGAKRSAPGGGSRGTGEWASSNKGGRVLHTLSHFGHQSSSDDGQALQNLIVNFPPRGAEAPRACGKK